MKTTLVFRYAIIFCLITCFSCSKDSVEEEEEFTICFIVKDKNTNAPVSIAKITVSYNDTSCAWGGCDIKYTSYGPEITDSNGEACIVTAKFRHPEHNYVISCKKNGYKTFSLANVSLNFHEIYLEPN